MNTNEAEKQKPDKGFSSVGEGLEELTLSLFGGLGFMADEEEEAEIEAAAGHGALGEAPPPKSKKLDKAAIEIANRPDKAENAFLAPELVQCLLPHSNPKDATVWAYRNGDYALVIQSGINTKTLKPYGLPWGSISKVLLVWVATEAVLHQSRHLKLKSKSFNDFMRLVGLDPATGGGKRGDAVRLKDHMLRLFNAIISLDIQFGNEEKGSDHHKNMLVAEETHFWWNFKTPEQGGLFESEIILGEALFKVLIANPVPLDIRAVAGLMRSPLAVDLYIWAKYRRFGMGKKGRKELKISIERLREQFGREYGRLDNFRAALTKALLKVKKIDPELEYHLDTQFLTLINKTALSAEQKAAAQKRLKDESPIDRVSDKARAKFKSEFPKWDVDVVIADFYSWRAEKKEVSINTDRHFESFGRTWDEKNR